MEPAISIRGLTKFYGDLRALDDFSMEVREGEFFGFLGPNGAGKTTTINILTGLTVYNDGDVKVFGNDVLRDYREARKLIGLVPQEFNFDDYFTVEEILRFYAGYFGIRRGQARKRVDELLHQFNLVQKSKTHVRKLSGGMKRRLLIARALIHNPRILILDEPTAGVDVELRRNLWRSMGIFTLLVSFLFVPIGMFDIFVFGYFLFFVSLIFSSIGVMMGLWAETFDHLETFSSFVLTPLTFLGGVFYSIETLPDFLKSLSMFNPLLFMINGMRYGVLGISDVNIAFSMGLVFILAAFLFGVNVWLFKRGYKIKT